MNTKEVPVLLLTGYLGSGKTTLVNKILQNKKGIRFAVIVNDIGEVNIDADLIQHQGVVKQADNSLISLQNGCICCTLQADLIDQIFKLLQRQQFDYIVIEASGICDPSPIAQTILTIPQMGGAYTKYGICRLDNVVTVVDALRMATEFSCGEKLTQQAYGEDDLENLLIQQIEFCSMILLNKVSEVSPEELERVRQIIRALQPQAPIIECDYAEVDLNRLIDTHCFDFGTVAASAGWVNELGKQVEEEHDHEHGCHGGHCHHHHHHNENGEAEEYGIGTFVYYRREPFDMNGFDFFVTSRWPKNIIRAKGVCYFNDEKDMSYMFEQAGQQKQLSKMGQWYATLSQPEIEQLFAQEPGLKRDWDPVYGDRMQKIVFIGQHLDKDEIVRMLDACLVK